MLIVDVEGEVSAASMVKDSKVYIEIAKFVLAYNTIVDNPNIFLKEIGDQPIDSENESLTWEQFVKIINTCDLGFNPVPTENQLAMYYSYAIQIGSISKEKKAFATVSDVAEAQKKYYNFIDDTTEKIEVQYNKQHQIAENRSAEAVDVQKNIDKKKLKAWGILCAMGFGVFLCGLGLAGLFFDIGIVKFFGFGNRYVGAGIFMVVGFCLFFFLDRIYVKSKYDYLQYKKGSEKVISRSEKTSRDELIMRDKLDKFREDLKIAKYELNDKDKSYDVKNCIEKLRLKNKYYQMLAENGEKAHQGLFDEMFKAGIDDLPMKDGRKSFANILADKLFGGLTPEETENLRSIQNGDFIGMGAGINKGQFDQIGKNPGKRVPKDDRRGRLRKGNSFDEKDEMDVSQQEAIRLAQEQAARDAEIAKQQEALSIENGSNAGYSVKFEDFFGDQLRDYETLFTKTESTAKQSEVENEKDDIPESLEDREPVIKEIIKESEEDPSLKEYLSQLNEYHNGIEQSESKSPENGKEQEVMNIETAKNKQGAENMTPEQKKKFEELLQQQEMQ